MPQAVTLSDRAPEDDRSHDGRIDLCPDCRQDLTRLRLKFWMYCIPGSRRYLCRKCGYVYLLVCDRWLLKLRKLLHKPGGPGSSWLFFLTPEPPSPRGG